METLEKPIIRFKRYLKDTKNWVEGHDNRGRLLRYYSYDPDFRIVFDESEKNPEATKKDIEANRITFEGYITEVIAFFKDGDGSQKRSFLEYKDIILEEDTWILCDNMNVRIPYPRLHKPIGEDAALKEWHVKRSWCDISNIISAPYTYNGCSNATDFLEKYTKFKIIEDDNES